MIKRIIQMILSVVILSVPLSAMAQDFGLDVNLGLKKKIVKGLSVAAEFELRTQDMSSEMERIDAGLDISYKPIDYFKIGIGYHFIDKYKLKRETKKGNIVDNYWSPRHRAHADITGIVPVGNLEVSLRERYQFTHRSETSAKKWSSSGEAKDDEIIESKNDHILRSRVLAQYNIKPIKLAPYFSIEIYNDLADSFSIDKVRLTTGMEYSVKKNHVFDLFYRYTAGIADSDDECHLLGVGYEFKF